MQSTDGAFPFFFVYLGADAEVFSENFDFLEGFLAAYCDAIKSEEEIEMVQVALLKLELAKMYRMFLQANVNSHASIHLNTFHQTFVFSLSASISSSCTT